MLIENHEPAATVFVPDAVATEYRLSMSLPHDLSHGKGSLASSLDAASLQRAVIELVRKLFVEPATEVLIDPRSRESLFPVLLDVACFDVESQEQKRLASRLRATFEADPLEDGMDHSAQQIIGAALRSEDGQRVLEWLRDFCLDAAHPSFAASVLRCLGRQERPGTVAWRTEVVRAALAMDDMEIRDAAVQATESWAEESLRNVLYSHSEPESWLRPYIRDVIDDLGE